MAPNTPTHYQLSQDKRLQIQALQTYGKLTYEQIAQSTGHSIHQVQLACQETHPTLKKKKGRPLLLKSKDINRLIEYITSSRYTYRLSYTKLAYHLDLNCLKLAIKSALNS